MTKMWKCAVMQAWTVLSQSFSHLIFTTYQNQQPPDILSNWELVVVTSLTETVTSAAIYRSTRK
jgi:hypothetical protein